jgi:hypothetical protein
MKDPERSSKSDKKHSPKKLSEGLKWRVSKVEEHDDNAPKGGSKEKQLNAPKSNLPKQPNPRHRDDKLDPSEKTSAAGSGMTKPASSNRRRA